MKPSPLPLLLLAACSSAPRTEYDPTLADQVRATRSADAERRELRAVLVRLDQGMESYSRAIASDTLRADADAQKIYKMLHEEVLDIGLRPVRPKEEPREPGTNYQRLQALAIDGSDPADQAIAVAALGFSGRPEVMPLLLQAAQLDQPLLVDRAVFGLAILRAPDTPPGVLGKIAANPAFSAASRTQAAWALYEIQGVSAKREECATIWRRFATELRDSVPPGVLVQAVRGLGYTRDQAHTPVVLPFLQHSMAKVREAAAIALGRLQAQQHTDALLELIGPKETVPNVRLAARKALSELAGRQDYGYDVAAWRKAFDRGR
jgi:hypothetical protein